MSKTAVIILTAVLTAIITSLFWGCLGSLLLVNMADGAMDLLTDDASDSYTPAFQVRVEHPDTVAIGEEFDLVVHVRNLDDMSLTVDRLDLGRELLAGLVVLDVAPDFLSYDDEFDAWDSYYFNELLSPYETTQFVFTMRADAAGVFMGDIDVCDPEQYYISITPGIRVTE